jgi:hypothetical protein
VLLDPADPLLDPAAPPRTACADCTHSQVGSLYWLVQFVAPSGLLHPLFASGFPAVLSPGFRALRELPPAGERFLDVLLVPVSAPHREGWWCDRAHTARCVFIPRTDAAYTQYVRALMGWRYYSTAVRESFSWGVSQWQVGATADTRRPLPAAAAAPQPPQRMAGAGGDGSLGSIPYVLFTADTGLTRSWRAGPDQHVCFDETVPTQVGSCPAV